jgi:hypothetical protein
MSRLVLDAVELRLGSAALVLQYDLHLEEGLVVAEQGRGRHGVLERFELRIAQVLLVADVLRHHVPPDRLVPYLPASARHLGVLQVLALAVVAYGGAGSEKDGPHLGGGQVVFLFQ